MGPRRAVVFESLLVITYLKIGTEFCKQSIHMQHPHRPNRYANGTSPAHAYAHCAHACLIQSVVDSAGVLNATPMDDSATA